MAKNKIKKGKCGIYLRRYKSELEEFTKQFNTVKQDDELKGYLVGVKGKKAYIMKATGDVEKDEKNLYKEKNVFCYGISLSTAVSKKSADFNDVSLIVFDEFIIEKGKTFYLPNEVDALLGFIETVARMRPDIQVLCLGNSVTMNNPHMIYWGMTKINKNREFTKDKDNLILIHHFKDADYIKAKDATPLGKLQRKSKIGNYMIDNEFINDNSPFIKPRTPKAMHICSINLYGKHLGVWYDYEEDMVFISKKVSANDNRTYSLTLEDRAPNILFLKMNKQNYHFRLLRTAFEYSRLFYDTQDVCFMCQDLNKILSI